MNQHIDKRHVAWHIGLSRIVWFLGKMGDEVYCLSCDKQIGNVGESVQYAHELRIPDSPVCILQFCSEECYTDWQQVMPTFLLETMMVGLFSNQSLDAMNYQGPRTGVLYNEGS